MPASRQDQIRIDEALISELLGPHKFSVPGVIRRELAQALDKKLNPPAWRVLSETGRSTPIIRYRDTGISLHVYTQVAGPDKSRRLHIAEMVTECLNARGLEVQ